MNPALFQFALAIALFALVDSMTRTAIRARELRPWSVGLTLLIGAAVTIDGIALLIIAAFYFVGLKP